jgi:hypothetical protein
MCPDAVITVFRMVKMKSAPDPSLALSGEAAAT